MPVHEQDEIGQASCKGCGVDEYATGTGNTGCSSCSTHEVDMMNCGCCVACSQCSGINHGTEDIVKSEIRVACVDTCE